MRGRGDIPRNTETSRMLGVDHAIHTICKIRVGHRMSNFIGDLQPGDDDNVLRTSVEPR